MRFEAAPPPEPHEFGDQSPQNDTGPHPLSPTSDGPQITSDAEYGGGTDDMSYPTPTAAALEELHVHMDKVFGNLFAEYPDRAQLADTRAEILATALAEFVGEDIDHPAVPTLQRGIKKLIFSVTDPNDLYITPPDEDVAIVLLELNGAAKGDLQVAANVLDASSTYLPQYVQVAQNEAGGQWEMMDASERLQATLRIARERLLEDFE